MAMRNWLCEPDKPETGGYILPNPRVTATIGNNIRAVLIGAHAYCEACKSTGVIVKAGGPRRMNFMGEIALEHDILLCKCPIPQRMISTTTSTHKYDDMIESLGPVASSTNTAAAAVGGALAATAASAQDEKIFDDRFILRESSGQAVANAAYAIKRTSGDIEYGQTDDNGHTHLLSAIAQSETIQVYLAG